MEGDIIGYEIISYKETAEKRFFGKKEKKCEDKKICISTKSPSALYRFIDREGLRNQPLRIRNLGPIKNLEDPLNETFILFLLLNKNPELIYASFNQA